MCVDGAVIISNSEDLTQSSGTTHINGCYFIELNSAIYYSFPFAMVDGAYCGGVMFSDQDKSSFTALPGGQRTETRTYNALTERGNWWTAGAGSTLAFIRRVIDTSPYLFRSSVNKNSDYPSVV